MKLKEVLKIIGKKNEKKFRAFMAGQTVGIVDNETSYYEWDVFRFCRIQGILKDWDTKKCEIKNE